MNYLGANEEDGGCPGVADLNCGETTILCSTDKF